MYNYRVIIKDSSPCLDNISIACAKSNAEAIESGEPSMSFDDIVGMFNFQKILYPSSYGDIKIEIINNNVMSIINMKTLKMMAAVYLDEVPDIVDEI
jgi:hypothetical protein